MIETPQIVETEGQETAAIRFRIPKAEMQEAFGQGVPELLGAVEEQGAEVVGPVFAHHFRMDSEIFDFELGVPVSAPVEPRGRVVPGKLPPRKVARTIYQGPYEGLPNAWAEFQEWVEEEKLPWRPDIVERYVVTPDGEPDPGKWRTELERPLFD